MATSTFIILIPEIAQNCSNCELLKIETSNRTIIFNTKTKKIRHIFNYSFEKIPRIYLYSLPKDFNKNMPITERKILFIKIILPQILRVNEKILTDREKIKDFYEKINTKKRINKKEIEWIKKVSYFYNCIPCSEKKLLEHVDIVIPSIAISQAAVESGWGMSRFSINGNAIFGLRTFNTKKRGMYPSGAENKNFKVATYETLLDSIWAYSINLNSHSSYNTFRKVRAKIRSNKIEYDLGNLVNHLENYSEKGKEYTDLVLKLIISNNMKYYDNLTLDDSSIK